MEAVALSAKAGYDSIAISEKAKRRAERLDANDAADLASAAQMAADEDADAYTGHWGMACRSGPRSENFMVDPPETEQLAGEVRAWASKLTQTTTHRDGLIAVAVAYNDVCSPHHMQSLSWPRAGQRPG